MSGLSVQRDGMTPALQATLDRLAAPRTGPWAPFRAEPAVIAEAQQLLAQLQRMLATPPSEDQIGPWLMNFRDLPFAPKDDAAGDQQLARMARNLALACSVRDKVIPGGMFADASLPEAMAAFDRFPTPPDVIEVMQRLLAPLKSRLAQLTVVANARVDTPPDPREPPATPQQIAMMAQALRLEPPADPRTRADPLAPGTAPGRSRYPDDKQLAAMRQARLGHVDPKELE